MYFHRRFNSATTLPLSSLSNLSKYNAKVDSVDPDMYLKIDYEATTGLLLNIGHPYFAPQS